MEGTLDETVLDHLPAAVIVVGRDGRIVRINGAAERFCARPIREAAGSSIFDVLREFTAADGLERAFRDAMDDGATTDNGYEAVIGHRDGNVVVRARWVARDAERYAVLLLQRAVGAGASDPRTTAELAQRIADVKHQINNPLMGILGHAELMMIDDAMPAEARNRAEIIQGEARRIRDQMELLDRLRRDLRS